MQLVYVLNKNGLPLMPTRKLGKVRHLLKEGRAKIIKRNPFTIQLNYECENYTQNATLGVDAGSKHIGLSASTTKDELYCSDVELRNDIVELLSTRRENRKTRRNHLRYREPRFNNRAKKKGWLAPSIRQKIDSHLKVIENAHKILPISKIRIEVASFDTQLLKAQEEGKTISDTDYQQGEQLGFWNIREYVLFRDDHECQCCHGKSKDKILETHHIESRKTGGNAPNNLITLCKTCHKNKPLDSYIYQKKARCHNRQIHRVNILKGGKKKLNQAPYVVKNFRLFDKVKYQNTECFIFGRRTSGYFDLRKLDGTKVSPSANYKKLELLKARENYLKEERSRQFLPRLEVAGLPCLKFDEIMPRPTQTATRTTSIVKDLISSKKAGKEKYRKELIFEPEMKERLETKASQEGLTVSAYIKRLVIKDLNM